MTDKKWMSRCLDDKAEPTPEDLEKAEWLLGNLTHYRNGGSYWRDDRKRVASRSRR